MVRIFATAVPAVIALAGIGLASPPSSQPVPAAGGDCTSACDVFYHI